MDFLQKYLKYKNKYLELKNQLGGNYPIGTSFLYAFSEDNVWSATLREVDWTGTIVIVFDGIVVPDKYKDGSMRGPANMEFINLRWNEQLDAPGTKLKLRLPEATDDEKRKAYEEEQNNKRSEATNDEKRSESTNDEKSKAWAVKFKAWAEKRKAYQ
jgi:chromatin remodeling complex protein RSC6